jgi:uncharacterized protein YbbK (DUF523 family)
VNSITPGRGAERIQCAPMLLVSACLLGDPVRYDGKAKQLVHDELHRLQAAGRLVAFCPEVAGGLPVPRAAAEIVGGDGADVIAGRARVATGNGEDVSAHFLAGAERALALCRQHGIKTALLTDGSPSCGSSRIYDGSFTRRSIAAAGVTTALLRQHGIRVFGQHQVDAAVRSLARVPHCLP